MTPAPILAIDPGLTCGWALSTGETGSVALDRIDFGRVFVVSRHAVLAGYSVSEQQCAELQCLGVVRIDHRKNCGIVVAL